MNFLGKIAITALAVLAAQYIFPEAYMVESWVTALVVGLVLGLLNAIVKPIMIIVTIPITFLTLGLFLLVINALMILLAEWLVPSFEVDGFWWALALSLFISLLNSITTKEERKRSANQSR